jgi:tripartite-type tricarboxylate transporter receptor subunit TctC
MMKPVLPMLALLFALAAGASLIQPAAAQSYPSKPVRWVVPFAAGGPTDIVARKLAERVSLRLGQSVIVENRPGAGTLIGTEAVLNAPADGYTMLVTNTALVQMPALMPNISYVPERDFLPVAQICAVPLVLVANAELKANDMAALIAWLRANPSRANYASPGQGGTANIYGAELSRLLGVKVEHVVYKGEAPIVPDFVANRIQWYFATPSQVWPFVQQGKARPIGVTGTDRLAKMPDVPTMTQLGFPSFETVGWFAMFAPVKTPRAAVERLSREVLAAAREPEFVRYLEDNMLVPKGVGSEQFAPEIARISTIWSRMIRDNDIRMQ